MAGHWKKTLKAFSGDWRLALPAGRQGPATAVDLKFRLLNRKTKSEETLDLDQDVITIGRGEENEITLSSKSISRKHAEISRKGNHYYLSDLESGNGTLLNGKKVRALEKTVLNLGDVIRIEEFEIHPILPSDDIDPEEHTETGLVEIRMLKKVLTALDPDKLPSIRVIEGPDKGKKAFFQEKREELVIGRDQQCDLFIDSDVVSRKHAALKRKWGGIVVQDLKSKNGVFIGNEKIEEKLLKDGDILILGTVKLQFRNPQEIDYQKLAPEKSESLLSSEPVKKKETESSKPKPSEKPETNSEEKPQASASAKASIGEENASKTDSESKAESDTESSEEKKVKEEERERRS